jgi:hypothetical protein
MHEPELILAGGGPWSESEARTALLQSSHSRHHLWIFHVIRNSDVACGIRQKRQGLGFRV